VQPRMTLDFVVDIFLKLGPRLVFVTDNDRLMGIVTKKDLLQYIRGEENHDRYLLHGRSGNNHHVPFFSRLFSSHEPISQEIPLEDLTERM
jgi:hypothetical protein